MRARRRDRERGKKRVPRTHLQIEAPLVRTGGTRGKKRSKKKKKKKRKKKKREEREGKKGVQKKSQTCVHYGTQENSRSGLESTRIELMSRSQRTFRNQFRALTAADQYS